jgi:hypothetical protein
MQNRFESPKVSAPWNRVVVALALAIGLGALPIQAAQNAQDSPPSSAPESEEKSAPQEAPAENPNYQAVPPTLDVAAGTVVTVRTSQFLSSDQNRPGDHFSAELQQPLVVDGWVVARRGQTVLGRVVVAQKAGRVKGVSQLGVELTYLVLVDGHQVPIHTQWMQTSGAKAHGDEAAAVGTTATIGAIIGAAADGGRGAAIGGATGAGAGLAGVLLTRGRPTVIPPESVLTFQLEHAVTISTAKGFVAFRPATPEDYEEGRTLERRRENFAVPRMASQPPYYGGYYPWGGFYPGPFFIGYSHFGGRHYRRW